jgi:hypothetical protein
MAAIVEVHGRKVCSICETPIDPVPSLSAAFRIHVVDVHVLHRRYRRKTALKYEARLPIPIGAGSLRGERPNYNVVG